jgi:nicotinamidase/pyrazinamidase
MRAIDGIRLHLLVRACGEKPVQARLREGGACSAMTARSASATQLARQLGLRHGDALIVVDVQRDFLPGGSLAVPDGDAVIGPLNAFIRAFDTRGLPILFTRDWHPANHCSFVTVGGRWPVHCVQETSGASWAEGLDVTAADQIVSKATDPSAEAYSAFSGTNLLSLLQDLGAHRVFVGGLATDYCVLETVSDARAHGLEVVVLKDAIRAVNAQPDDEARALHQMQARGATFFTASGYLAAQPNHHW